jgi:hypothetical protein
VEWDGKTVIAGDFRAVGNVLSCVVTFRVGGEERPFSNPWKLVDPPGDSQEWFEQAVMGSGFFRG